MKINSILFVCTGNTCRSPMAERIFSHMLTTRGVEGVRVRSGGISCLNGFDMMDNAKQALENMQTPSYPHYTTRVGLATLEEYDLVVTMTTTHKYVLGAGENVYSMQDIAGYDIADPYGGTQDDYNTCAYNISKALEILYEKYFT